MAGEFLQSERVVIVANDTPQELKASYLGAEKIVIQSFAESGIQTAQEKIGIGGNDAIVRTTGAENCFILYPTNSKEYDVGDFNRLFITGKAGDAVLIEYRVRGNN